VSLFERAHEVASFRDAGQSQNLAQWHCRRPDQLFRLAEPELSQKPSWTHADLPLKKMGEMRDG
jgi:hypothetical protein